MEEILSENESQLPKEGNPIEHVGQLKRSPILDLVMPKDREISQKRIDGATMLASRNRNEGYGDFSDMEEENSTLSTLFFGEYLLQKFSDFTKIEEGGALDYELEYILAGADSDRENLEAVVHKMMMLRFVPNYLYIQTDGEMKAEAEAMALTLCTLLAVPAVTEAAAQVILLAWSYGETVMDLRSLLKGNRVPVVKSKESWQLQLASLLTLGTKEDKAECMDAERGLPYEEYLRILLFLEEKETAALRALGMIEQNIKTVYGQAFFHADDCVSRMEVESVCKLRRGIHYDFMTYYGYQ